MNESIIIAAGTFIIGGVSGFLLRYNRNDKDVAIQITELKLRVHKLEGGQNTWQSIFMSIQQDLRNILIEIEKLKK